MSDEQQHDEARELTELWRYDADVGPSDATPNEMGAMIGNILGVTVVTGEWIPRFNVEYRPCSEGCHQEVWAVDEANGVGYMEEAVPAPVFLLYGNQVPADRLTYMIRRRLASLQ